ncbi:hypothetical protein [Halobellus salinisoli]|uniref:hypothetical protein n=1 Tax=Halobellus salinisoli TaxID=3108500 RepID=UPI00300B5F39
MSLLSSAKTWSAFCGVSQSVFETHLSNALQATEYAHRRSEGDGSFMLGQEPSVIYAVDTPDGEATITVFFASGDPMLRFFSSFRTGGEESLGNVCVVKVRYEDPDVERHIRDVFARTAESLPKDPAAVGHHPRFRLAPIARWRTKRKWRRWLDN